YRHCPATSGDATAEIRGVAVDNAIRYGQHLAIAADAAAVGEGGKVVDDAAAAECKPSVVKDATSSVGKCGKAVSDGKTGYGNVRSEIFKHAESGVAVDRQISSTGAVDGHVVVNLKFTAGQQDGAGDPGGVNRVAVTGNSERDAQRAESTVIGVCDKDG